MQFIVDTHSWGHIRLLYAGAEVLCWHCMCAWMRQVTFHSLCLSDSLSSLRHIHCIDGNAMRPLKAQTTQWNKRGRR